MVGYFPVITIFNYFECKSEDTVQDIIRYEYNPILTPMQDIRPIKNLLSRFTVFNASLAIYIFTFSRGRT